MSSIFEMCMLIAFGFAWPTSIIKSWRIRTAVGKSPMFLVIVLIGYICGIISKFYGNQINYILIFYSINLAMVATDLCLYFRNRALDRKKS
ncbi:MAG: hypothetical protein Q8876_03855 [Bacillota bacterium]|nr:hypothetical protein [Bacillota bacterium]